MWSIIGRLFETLQASFLYLPYLITDEPPAHHVATQLSQGIGRDRLALGGAQAVEAFGGLLQLGIEAAGYPSRINVAFILLTIRLCSPTRLSCSRLGRLASSSLIVGIATILQ